MRNDTTNSHDPIVPASHCQFDGFVRELEERLYDGCSVTFTVPHHIGTTLARDVLNGLEARECFAAEIDLSDVSTVEQFALRVLRAALHLRTGVNTLSGTSMDCLLEYMSRPDIRAKIEDFADVSHLRKLNPLALLDEAVSLLQSIPEQSNTRLVVWFHEWQEVARLKDGDLLLKRLRGMFQVQTHVTYTFTGSRDHDLLRTLFADRDQALYRFAVELKYPE